MGRRTGMGKTMGENINGTCELWLGYTSKRTRRDLIRALRLVAPHAALSFLGSAKELRDAFLDEEPGTVGAMVGLSERLGREPCGGHREGRSSGTGRPCVERCIGIAQVSCRACRCHPGHRHTGCIPPILRPLPGLGTIC